MLFWFITRTFSFFRSRVYFGVDPRRFWIITRAYLCSVLFFQFRLAGSIHHHFERRIDLVFHHFERGIDLVLILANWHSGLKYRQCGQFASTISHIYLWTRYMLRRGAILSPEENTEGGRTNTSAARYNHVSNLSVCVCVFSLGPRS